MYTTVATIFPTNEVATDYTNKQKPSQILQQKKKKSECRHGRNLLRKTSHVTLRSRKTSQLTSSLTSQLTDIRLRRHHCRYSLQTSKTQVLTDNHRRLSTQHHRQRSSQTSQMPQLTDITNATAHRHHKRRSSQTSQTPQLTGITNATAHRHHKRHSSQTLQTSQHTL